MIYKERSSNFELLRLLLMFLIVLHHGIIFGIGLGNFSSTLNEKLLVGEDTIPYYAVINALCIVGVNCFVLLSGFFAIKPNVEKFKLLVFQILFYTLFLTAVPQLIIGNYSNFFNSLRIFSNSGYWFFVDYMILMILAPVLNLSFLYLNKRENRIIMYLLLFVSIYLGFFFEHPVNKNGYTVFQFITLYHVGRYLQTYDVTWSKIKCIILYSVPCVITGLLMNYYITSGNIDFAWHTMHYNSPLIILASISLLLLFKNVKLKSRFINNIAKSSFSIYLIQNSAVVSTLYYGIIKKIISIGYNDIILIVVTLAVLSIIIIMISIILDQLRLRVYNVLNNSTIFRKITLW